MPLVTTYGGTPVREPVSRSRFDEEAALPKVVRCAFCSDVCEGTYCNAACEEAGKYHAAEDARADLAGGK